MQAALYDRYGPPEVIRIGERPDPKPGSGEVLVRVRAAALNPKDVIVRSGRFRLLSRGPFPRLCGYDFAGVVEAPGPRPHGEAVAAMRAADLLFLPTPGRRDGRPVTRVSQKLYEYLRAGPPVLAVTGRGDTRDLVLDSGAGFAVPPGRPEGIETLLRAMLAGAPLPLDRQEDVIARYERRRLAGNLAEVLREALDAGRRRPEGRSFDRVRREG